jgi:hypothetical protein
LSVTTTWHFLGYAFEADWVEAWVTAIAAAGTLGTLWYAARGLARERRPGRRRSAGPRQEQRQAQAAQARTVVDHQPGGSGSQFQFWSRVEFQVVNYGPGPITSIAARISWDDSPDGEGEWRQQEYPKPVRVGEFSRS